MGLSAVVAKKRRRVHATITNANVLHKSALRRLKYSLADAADPTRTTVMSEPNP